MTTETVTGTETINTRQLSTLTINFDFDLALGAPDLESTTLRFKSETLRAWDFVVAPSRKSSSRDDGRVVEIRFTASATDVPRLTNEQVRLYGRSGTSIDIFGTLRRTSTSPLAYGGVVDTAYLHSSFPNSDPLTHTSYRLAVKFTRNDDVPMMPRALAKNLAHLHLSASAPDVRIVFPHARSGKGAELWTTRALLSAASPYYATLFASGFAESQAKRPSKRARPPAVDEAELDTGDDSDDEVDSRVFKSAPPPAAGAPAEDHAYHELKVTTAAYSTYRAVLLYLASGFIDFLPLASSCLPSNPAASSTHPELVKTRVAAASAAGLPAPVSPKSVYKLADLLQLPDLAAQALDAYAASLTHAGAPAELFSPAALAYDELRAKALAYVVQHWAQVKGTDGWKAQKERVRTEGNPAAASVLVEVFEAIAEK